MKNNNVSNRLTEFRLLLGLNQTKFAQILEVPRTTVIGYESGNSIPADFLAKLHDKFDLNIEWFLFKEAQEPFNSDENNRLKNQPFGVQPLHSKELKNQPIDLSEESEASAPDDIQDSLKKFTLASTAPKFAELEEKMDGKFSAQEEKLNGLQKRLEDLESAFSSGAKPKEAPLPRDEEVKEAAPPYGADCEADEEETVELPLAENLAAGMPREAFTTGETFSVPAKFLKKRKKYCVAKIKGTSMTDAGIADGAFVLLEMNETPVDDMIVLARYDDQTTLKRLREKEGGGWELRYEDGSGAIIPLKDGEWEVIGWFVRVVGSEKKD